MIYKIFSVFAFGMIFPLFTLAPILIRVTIEPGRGRSGPPVSTDSTGGGRRRPPPVESVVDQIYAAKPYAN